MTEMSTVQAVGHRTAKRNGTWLTDISHASSLFG